MRKTCLKDLVERWLEIGWNWNKLDGTESEIGTEDERREDADELHSNDSRDECG